MSTTTTYAEVAAALKAAGFSAAEVAAALMGGPVTATIVAPAVPVIEVAAPRPQVTKRPPCRAEGCTRRVRATGKRLCAAHFADSTARAEARRAAWAESAPERSAKAEDFRTTKAAAQAAGKATCTPEHYQRAPWKANALNCTECHEAARAARKH
jgi:hypothetical protein